MFSFWIISDIDEGEAVETVWDVTSLVTGVKSFAENARAGNFGAAALDGVGIIADSAAVVLPGIPGGASVGIKAGRSVTNTIRLNNLNERAKIGCEAHRQIQNDLHRLIGGKSEVSIILSNGQKVRKDFVSNEGVVYIIKPDTDSGHRSAYKRKKLMEGEGYIVAEPIFYDPSDPKYREDSPSYIGPKHKQDDIEEEKHDL
ncbi:MAG: hypothetical protein IIX29_01895 [Bacteroidales bacterium]|nr:hypothetical protein [Bacteroidales bacterium]